MASSATRFAAAGMAALLLLAVPSAALAAESTSGPVPARTVVPKVAPPKSTPALAPTIAKEEALALVKRHFKLPDGPGRLEVELSPEYRPTWQIMYWVDRGSGTTGNSFATVDATTGRIRQVDVGNRLMRLPPTGPLGQPHSEEEGRERAWSLIQTLLPEESASLRPAPPGSNFYSPYSEFGAYNYTWMQYHNEVPVSSSIVRVTIDRYSLDAVSYHDSLQTEATYPPTKAVVSQEEAFALFKAAAVPVLRYQPIYQPQYSVISTPTQPEMKLVYEMDLPFMLDPVTGKPVGFPGDEVPVPGPEPVSAGGDPLKAAALPLTEADAIALARQILELPPDAEMRVDPPGEGPQISVNSTGSDSFGAVTLNRKTGMVVHAYRSGSSQGAFEPGDADSTPTAEQKERAKQEAIRAVQRFYSQQLPDLKLNGSPGASPWSQDLGFRFQRYVHGIAYGFDSITVNVDRRTGRWTQLSTHWQDEVKVPEPTGVIEAQKAHETYFAERTVRLVYQSMPRLRRLPTGPGQEPGPAELMLVHQLALSPQASHQNTYGIDAFTGQWIPAEDPLDLKETDAKLTGHWAEGELRYALARLWVAPATLNPDGATTRLQAMNVLLSPYLEMGNWSNGNQPVPYKDIPQDDAQYHLVQQGIGSGMLQPTGEAPLFGGDEAISRAEFAVWIVRLLGLGDLAKSGLNAEASHTDLSGLTAEQRNAVAFLEALGMLAPGGQFRGEDPLTQAEAAAMMVRFLGHLQKTQ